MTDVAGLSADSAAQIAAMEKVNKENRAWESAMYRVNKDRDQNHATFQSMLVGSQQLAQSGR